jgi:peptidoglycan hydrolase-like protein with peptidoglycan-binding domain
MRKQGLIATAAAIAATFCLTTIPTAPASAQQQTRPAANTSIVPADQAIKKGDQNVANIQTALNKSGANVKVDGKMGPQTRNALRKFQQSNNLKVTGAADSATRAKLGV